MKASYMVPSGTYNLILSKEDLIKLLEKGCVSVTVGRDVPCNTGRGIYDFEKHKMITLDKKEVYNDLRFCLHEPLADIEGGFHNVQFLNIHLDMTGRLLANPVLSQLEKEKEDDHIQS